MSTYRVPPAVKWLVKNRKALAGRVATLEKRLGTLVAQQTVARTEADDARTLIERLRSDLEAIDQTIRLHEMGIDPDLLGHTRVQTLLIAKPGAARMMTRELYACFRSAPLRWQTSTEIATWVAKRTHPTMSAAEFPLFRDSVRMRIRGIIRGTQRIARHPGRTGNDEARYRLCDELIDEASSGNWSVDDTGVPHVRKSIR